MKRVLSLVLIFILVFAVASCGDKKKKDDVKEKVSKEISAEDGGTVSTSDESVAVDIPADALDSNTTITVSVYESSHYATAKGEKVISTVVEFEPSGTVFKKPIIIKMTANNEIKDKVVAAAVYNEAKGAWSYSEHSEYAILVGKDAAGDPIMQTAAGDPIMLNAAGDPIMMSAAGDPIMLASAGDPIMLASAGDPIMSNAAGDPIMNAAAGDPIMMTTGHFTAYTFIVVEESDSQAGTVDADADTNDGDEDVSPDEDNAPECGNGVVEEGEECDNGSDNGKTDCAYGEKSCELCTKECKKQAGSVAYCGDGTKQGNEVCDKADPESGKGEGIGASCSDDCQIATLSCGTLPENAQWVNGDTYELTRNGEEYTSSVSAHYAESGDCAYQCKPTYSWIDSSCTCQSTEHVENGECKSNTQAAASCGTLPANAQWVSGDTYVPTWNGSAYSSATANYAESGDCAYKCKSTYSWIDSSCTCQSTEHVENGVCTSNTQAAASCGTLPANAQWVGGDTYVPTWNGSAYSSATANYAESGDCAYQCKPTYSWIDSSCTCTDAEHVEGGVCKSNTQAAASCGTLPANAQWVSGDTYIPTWNGTAYSSAAANYAESGDCAYKCKTTYSWIDSNCTCTDAEHVEDGVCKSNTQAAASCGTLPANAQWVSGDTYVPTWNGTAYSSAAANYAESGDCAYQCKPTYTWVETNETCACTDAQHVENDACVSNTGEAQNCTNIPANAAWKVGTYTPHWVSGAWSTEPAATYFEEEGEECTFECVENFHYEEGSCQSDTKPAESCGTLPANAQWVSGDTYVPTWNGSAYSSATANYAEEGDCAYKCKATYIWVETNGTCACPAEQHVENDACVSDTGTAQNCTNLPSNAAWVAATYIPHWSNGAWSTEPEATYFEDEGEECTFECVANYHYEEEICQSDTKPAESCGDLPENAQWVQGNTYIPTWNGKGYPYYTAHYAEEGDCAFICLEDYEWNEDTVKCSIPVAKVLCTGQTKCYDAEGSVIDCPLEGEEFYGQDANYTARQSCTPQVYEKISEETNCISDNDACNIVDDLSTGLRWYFYTGFGTWDNAYTFCDTLDTGEGREWRLPTAKELMSIIDSGSSYPALRMAYFRTGMYSSNSYWSGTYFQNQKTGEDEVLILDTGHGYLKYESYGKEGSNYFACVSGTEYGVAGTFTEKNISGGTVVTDSTTDLMWKAATELDMNWSQALAYCEDLNYAGYSDWRLPNRNEFATILNYTGKEYGDSKSDFPDIIGGNYWTSTFAPDYGGSAGPFIMEVGGGTMFSVGETQGNVTTAYTLCVRSDVAQYSAVPACDESGYTPCEDAETGIVWSQDVNDSDDEVDYLEAAMMCRESKQGGISQWRVATISEIRTILRSDGLDECYVSDECSEISSEVCYDSEICETGTAIESAFHDYTFMVSGTQTGEGEGYSWRVNFQTGAIESHHGEYIYVTPSIRCVKDNSIPNVGFPYTDEDNSLVWSELSSDKLSWDEANEYCTEDDEYAWRLPTIEELATLVQGCHDGGCAPDIYGAYSVFGDVSTLWSSTVTRNQLPTNVETYYNVLDFMTASQTELTSDAIRTFYTKVRCVADVDENPSPCDLYPCEDIENSDGTCSETLDGGYICGCDEGYEWDGEECWATEPDFPECSHESEFPCIDSEYELVWSSLAADTMTWDDAGSYCENLEEGGYDDWRLPTIDELRTVIQNCPGSQSGGACAISDPDHLSNSDFSNDCYCDSMGNNNGYYSRLGDDDLVSLWSSSTTSGNTDRAWRVGFDDAYVYGYNKSGNNNVRCVR